MAIVSSTRPGTGSGGGTGEQQRWKRDSLTQTAAWASGALSISLTSTPTDSDAILVWSQGLILSPDDYSYASGVVTILFSADPATDSESGSWNFIIQYPYIL